MRPVASEIAAAKLNLALSVGPPGVDRMHPISSWMVTVDFGDELTVQRLEDDSLSRYAIVWHADARRRSQIDWSITRDLAVRAHLALERHHDRTLPVQLLLQKRIPVGGGLGGGSSNAAAMLRAVNRLFDLGMSPEELATIGAGLGSDVPFLVHGGSAVVEGLGERVERRTTTSALDLVLVLPEASCPTGAVYAAFDRRGSAGLRSEAIRALATHGRPDPGALFNDLAEAAMEVAPPLSSIASAVGNLAERPVHVTGSGSTLFTVCDDRLHSEALAKTIDERLGVPAIAVRTAGGEG
ncbi:MAG: 4-(cytidine 5'-diphospho)-2-C-methyl-D-erythritol kinase [Phycisphaerales bacterium]|nr:4-(cytidine 5'-diphospho)-2-C-methyl-D-erythritol kinase [Phycisphaerales bacterium]